MKKNNKLKVSIIMGSQSDYKVMKLAEKTLKKIGVSFETKIISAHRTPQRMYEYAAKVEQNNIGVIIAGAGGSAHLPGMISALTHVPVLGVPVESKKLKGLDSLLSIAQMPKGIPVGTLAIGEDGAINAALLAAAIIANNNSDVRKKLKEIFSSKEIYENLNETVTEADLVFLCVPVGSMRDVAKRISNLLKKGCILTDTGSTKNSVINDVNPYIPTSVNFIPSHPLAGTEYSGPKSGFSSLFENRYWLIVCNKETDNTKKLAKFFKNLGSIVETVSAEYHDKILAITSHLPHLIAFTIVGTDANGAAATVTRAGPNNNTVDVSGTFLTVTSISSDASIATNISAGVKDGAATGTLFAGATRIRGMSGNGAGAGHINFKNGSQSGTTQHTEYVRNDLIDPYIPDDGIRFPDGCYMQATASAVVGLSIYFDG